jgi:hypothetical protein
MGFGRRGGRSRINIGCFDTGEGAQVEACATTSRTRTLVYFGLILVGLFG